MIRFHVEAGFCREKLKVPTLFDVARCESRVEEFEGRGGARIVAPVSAVAILAGLLIVSHV
jgi:hypothetical protein